MVANNHREKLTTVLISGVQCALAFVPFVVSFFPAFCEIRWDDGLSTGKMVSIRSSRSWDEAFHLSSSCKMVFTSDIS